MSLREFIKESKAYMGYGEYTPKSKFWLMLPFAYLRFKYYSRGDK